MKGRTTCPKCKREFVMDIPEYTEKLEVECPKCGHSFKVKPVSEDKPVEEYGWEEHGEPRKTILSSFKKKTNRPIIASFLLLTISVLGIFTAVVFISDDVTFFPQLDVFISYLTTLCFDNKVFLSIIIVIFSGFALAGFVTAFKRRHFLFTAVCAFIGIFSIGFFIGLILSIVALGLIITCRDEFEDGTKGKVF